MGKQGNVREGEQYTIRRQLFKLVGAGFHVYDPSGEVVAYCKQKAFKLREDLRFYTDESQSQELFSIRARQVIDFSSTYDVVTPEGAAIGSLRRKGMKSMFRDEWVIFAPADAVHSPDGTPHSGPQIGTIQEDSMGLAMVRRFIGGAVGAMLPQKFVLTRADGVHLATFRTHINPVIYRLGISIEQDLLEADPNFDDLLILAAGCLLAAIEGRQQS